MLNRKKYGLLVVCILCGILIGFDFSSKSIERVKEKDVKTFEVFISNKTTSTNLNLVCQSNNYNRYNSLVYTKITPVKTKLTDRKIDLFILYECMKLECYWT